MKYSMLGFLIVPICIQAQDCKLKKTTDPYTKEITLSTGFIQFDGASVSVNADSKEIDFFFSMDGKEKCFSDGATAIVNYEGKKSKATFRNDGPVNCEGIFHIIFKNGPTEPTLLQRFITQKITSIQFIGNNKSQVTVTLTEEEQQSLMTRADCLVKQAKTLVK
jgi:hypothetical protein